MRDDLPNPLNRMDNMTPDPNQQSQSYQYPQQPQNPPQQQNPYGQGFTPGGQPPAGGFAQAPQQPMQNYAPMQPNYAQQPAYNQPQPMAMNQSPEGVGPAPKTVNKIEQIFIFVYIFMAALLLFRFILSLFGASVDTSFVSFVYDLTAPFMIPFDGMFGASPGVGDFRIEFEVIVAIVVYALVFFGLARLVRILFR